MSFLHRTTHKNVASGKNFTCDVQGLRPSLRIVLEEPNPTCVSLKSHGYKQLQTDPRYFIVIARGYLILVEKGTARSILYSIKQCKKDLELR